MLQVFQRYVASDYSKCFICFRRMLQVFYLDVAYVAVAIHIYCKCLFQMFHLFRSHVASRLSCCMCRLPALVSTRAVRPSRGHRRGKEAPVWKRLARFLSRGVWQGEVIGAHRVRAGLSRGRGRVIRAMWDSLARVRETVPARVACESSGRTEQARASRR
jgi:hypothetical protein